MYKIDFNQWIPKFQLSVCDTTFCQLSDMVVTYQHLPEGEQPAAFHLLQTSLAPLLTVPAEWGHPDHQYAQQLDITEHHVTAQQQVVVEQGHMPAVQDHQHVMPEQEQEQVMTDQGQEIAGDDDCHGAEESDDVATAADHLTPEEDHVMENQEGGHPVEQEEEQQYASGR